MLRRRLARIAFLFAFAVLAQTRPRGAEPVLLNVAGPAYGTRVAADTQFDEKHLGGQRRGWPPGARRWLLVLAGLDQLPCAFTLTLAQEEDVRRVVLYQARWTGTMYHTCDFALETFRRRQSVERAATGQLADDSLASVALGRAPAHPLAARVVGSSSPLLTTADMWPHRGRGLGRPAAPASARPRCA